MAWCGRLYLLLFQEGLDCGFVKFFGLTFDDLQGPGRAGTEAGAEPVAELVGHQSGLAVDDPQGAFRAIGYALAAAIAQFFIDLDNFPYVLHILSSRLMGWSSVPAICPQYNRNPLKIFDLGQYARSFIEDAVFFSTKAMTEIKKGRISGWISCLDRLRGKLLRSAENGLQILGGGGGDRFHRESSRPGRSGHSG